MKKPPAHSTLRAEAGEALIARGHQRGLSAEDAGVVEQVIRLSCWGIVSLQEAKLRLKRLRTLLCGTGAQAPKPRAPEAASPSSAPGGEGEGAGTWRSRAAASAAELGASGPAALAKPTGGQRLGTGRLGAEASEGAERVECRQEELAVGQRCPVCGQGTCYA